MSATLAATEGHRDAALRPARVLLAVVLALSSGCKAKEAEFYRKAFPCDLNAAPNTCGTTWEGKPMACYPGHLLGGQDFCAATCDPASTPEDPRYACVSQGALLQRCHVAGAGMKDDDPASRCPEGLECLRTNLLGDEGLCLMMQVCTEDTDCQRRTDGRSVCAGTLIHDLTASSSFNLATDSLMCIQDTCSSQGSSCPPDEGCLFSVYSSGGILPDICVPKCDSNLRCPPSFSCARSDLTPGSPALCIPGVPGARCQADAGCLVGECLDTGAGFRICTLPISCRPIDFCSKLNTGADDYFCVEGIPGRPVCVTTRPFGGGNCVDTSGCPEGQECYWYDQFSAGAEHGNCRVPCDDDGRCAPRGGVPFVCLGENHEQGCLPSGFGLPCLDDSECFGGFVCALVGPDPRSKSNYNPRICTAPCAADADCSRGFCQTEPGFCRNGGAPGAPCTRDTHCLSRRCDVQIGCL